MLGTSIRIFFKLILGAAFNNKDYNANKIVLGKNFFDN